jgi:hypothetical protein
MTNASPVISASKQFLVMERVSPVTMVFSIYSFCCGFDKVNCVKRVVLLWKLHAGRKGRNV